MLLRAASSNSSPRFGASEFTACVVAYAESVRDGSV